MSSASARLVSSQGHAAWDTPSHLLTKYHINIKYTDFLIASCELLFCIHLRYLGISITLICDCRWKTILLQN